MTARSLERRAFGAAPPLAHGLLVALLAFGLQACGRTTARPPVPVPVPVPVPDAATWVEQTLASLSLEEKVGQLLMGRIMAFESVHGSEVQDLVGALERLHLGGVAISVGSPLEIAVKANAFQTKANVPLLIAGDLEYGPGMRLWSPVYLPYVFEGSGGTVLPYNMGLGAIGDPAAAEAAGRLTAREARAVGIHWLFAPVLDVNTQPLNPIVNVRSYGSDPALVASLGAAFIRGAQAEGVLTAAKHFPGHGDTELDSHLQLPVLAVGRTRLDSLELAPFRAAVQAGATGIMLGHLAVPALTGGRNLPASVSPELTTGLLRQDLGFDGLVVTDAMTMGALRALPGYDPGELAVWAVEAGADVVLSPPDAAAAHRALVEAVRAGRISESRLSASVRRILTAKARVGLHRERLVRLDSVAAVVASPAHEELAQQLAARSIVLARDSAGLVPLDPRRVHSLAVIAFTTPTDLTGGRTLYAELGRSFGEVTLTRLHAESAPAELDSAFARALRADATIFAVFLAPVSGQGFIRVPEPARALAQRLFDAGRRTVTVSFGDPYGPAALPGASSYLLAWQPRGPAAQLAAARALAGRQEITGRLPVDLPGAPRGSGIQRARLDLALRRARAQEVGMDEARLARVDQIIREAIATGATPGAALAIGRHGRLVRLGGYGTLDWASGSPAVSDSSIYDLASLTKVVATTTAAMLLVDEGRLDLDAPVAHYLPEWQAGQGKERVTVRHLLAHSSGLTAGYPLWRELRGKEAFVRRIAALGLEVPPGARTVYSDFGVILLGAIIERLTGEGLDALLERRLVRPLGLRDTRFNPLEQGAAPAGAGAAGANGAPALALLLERIAPTELDTIFRKTHVHGRVHDENAFAMGGVAGHAGLFSSARDLAVFAQFLLNGGAYGDARLLRPSTVRRFTRRQSSASSRALGWDTPTATSSAGAYFSAASFGHTGFTGTSIWIDPERDVFVVLLTNRVNPTRANLKHEALRRAVHDAVQQAIVDVPVVKR